MKIVVPVHVIVNILDLCFAPGILYGVARNIMAPGSSSMATQRSFHQRGQRSLDAYLLRSRTTPHKCKQKKASRWRVRDGVFSGAPLCKCQFIPPISSTSALHNFSLLSTLGAPFAWSLHRLVKTSSVLRSQLNLELRANCAVAIAMLVAELCPGRTFD